MRALDVANPIRSLAPTVDADVLLVLIRTHAWLTGARVSRIAGRSYAQVRAVLRRLTEEGIVDVEQHGNTFSYRCNRAHVVSAAIEALAAAAERAEHRIAEEVGGWTTPPHSVAVFGSFARRDGGRASDLDLLLVRPDEVSEQDEVWRRQRHDLARATERWTGNRTQVLELSIEELRRAVILDEALVTSLRRDATVLAGTPLNELLTAP